MHPSNELWILMARCLSGEASAEEENKFLNSLKQNHVLQQQYDMLLQFWKKNDKDNFSQSSNKDVTHILALAKKYVDDDNIVVIEKNFGRRRFAKILYSVAAVIILLIAGVWFFSNKNFNNRPQQISINKTVSIPNGERTKIILPDGTSVWLNSGSKLTYNNNFSGPLREVNLNGEAYFDVIKNVERPFIVHTGGVNIKVLGTAFNVKSYPADKTVETTLLRGLVQVTREYDTKQKPVFLHPNQKIIIEKVVAVENNDKLSDNKKIILKQPASSYKILALDSSFGENTHIETAWVNNRIAFRGDNFEELAQKLERWYNVKIIFQDEKVKKLSFNGSFENETPEQAFTALKAASPFNFKIEGNKVFVSSTD